MSEITSFSIYLVQVISKSSWLSIAPDCILDHLGPAIAYIRTILYTLQLTKLHLYI